MVEQSEIAAQANEREDKQEEKMAVDGQTTIEEGGKQRRPLYRRLKDHWKIALRLVEIAIGIVNIAFILDPAKKTGLGSTHLHHFALIITTFCGFLLINCMSLVARAIGDRQPYRTSALISLVASAMSLAAGCLILSDRAHFTNNIIFHPNKYLMDMMCTSGIFAIIACVVYAFDAIVTWRYQVDL